MLKQAHACAQAGYASHGGGTSRLPQQHGPLHRCTETDLASMPARVADAMEASVSDEGEVMLRATEGHEPEAVRTHCMPTAYPLQP